MKLFISVLSAITLTTFTMSSAIAGPDVKVTFKNFGDAVAAYSPRDNNELMTRLNSKPSPKTEVDKGDTDSFDVKGRASPYVSYAIMRYVMGSKVCVFSSTFAGTPGFAGAIIPKWNHTVAPSGGARCNIRSTGVNLSNYSWSVEITMQ